MLKFVVIVITAFSGIGLYGQPYYDTHVKNKFVDENIFLKIKPDTSPPPEFLKIKSMLPQPLWPARQDVISCYWKAWEIAFSNLHIPTRENGFVSPYIDAAFNGNIFMGDSGFMLMFGKYGIRVFNFQGTIDNFYAKQHADGFICREIHENNGGDNFERFDPSSTGPDILPWTEWEYYLNFNDRVRLNKVFAPLLAYYQWYKTYRSWPDGTYYSSGWGCMMDNQPRVPEGENPEWSHGHMSWIDGTLQQIYAGRLLVEMAKRLGRENDVKEIESETERLGKFVNSKMWDERTAFYYDRYKDGSLSEVKSIAAYWALLANVVDQKNADKFVLHLSDTREFSRMHRVPSLSADVPGYNPDGGYWLGSVWAPTNYMVLRGLTNYHKDSLAYEIAINHLNNVVEVFRQTGTLWENYAPDKVQGNNKKDFVGWTGLAPIAELIEYVFGIRADVPGNSLTWDIRMKDEYGISQLPFGKNGLIKLYCHKRNNTREEPQINVSSNVPFSLNLCWEGGTKKIDIKPGNQ
ncbi:MAG: trehalase family glycosidase [Bacteroidetes bacterium]|nr:trehalase family glycosidase [Bacteroidota bacterium]